ncbi:MAG: NADH-quinone oxidoreductase subunit J [Proteobacteria bacterium]|nr:NADH-quinone oxidoreductase subunit J [Cystobacterineae bacterium]MCL2258334.1 NADH-quinone oxidoreductase subunit J [Cystobacterineae bacterium]MCL2315359.1 NADH-quinone oxidoreductase subunit J [Pseudomonadota bacterium]
MNVEIILFFVFSVCTLVGASLVVFANNPLTSAMSLVATFFFLAAIYVLLYAHAIAALQVMVYAGAVMVLFLLVIMLLPLQNTPLPLRPSPARWVGALSTASVLGALIYASLQWQKSLETLTPTTQTTTMSQETLMRFGNLEEIGLSIYTKWLFPFEALSLLLLAAILGAVVIAKARI